MVFYNFVIDLNWHDCCVLTIYYEFNVWLHYKSPSKARHHVQDIPMIVIAGTISI